MVAGSVVEDISKPAALSEYVAAEMPDVKIQLALELWSNVDR